MPVDLQCVFVFILHIFEGGWLNSAIASMGDYSNSQLNLYASSEEQCEFKMRSSAGPHSNHSNINHKITNLVYVLFGV